MKNKQIFREVPNRGLRIDDIYNLLYAPNKFELTEGNQNQFFALVYNINNIVKSYKK